jgi:hypothetical protein
MLVIDTDSNVSGHIPLLKSKSVGVVGRYFSAASWKRISKSEAQEIAAGGLQLFVIFENSGDPTLDSDAGTSDAQLALQQAGVIGQPINSAIYFALEHLPNGYTNQDVPGVINYIQQVRAVLAGKYKIGAYSDGVILDALLTEGLIDYAWLSASRGFAGSAAFYASRRWALAQNPQIDMNWDGLSIDLNETKNDFGQFALSAPQITAANVVLNQRLASPQLMQIGSINELPNVTLPSNRLGVTPGGALVRSSQRNAVTALAAKVVAAPEVLQYAKNIATAIVDGPSNHCAATLSALLVFVGIFPIGLGDGSGDLEPLVLSLAGDLQNRRGWTQIPLGQRFENGDVGVVIAPGNVHHIYLVVDSTNQNSPIIADNQLSGIHARPVAGDPAQNFSPTSYFLRAPA